MADNRPGGARSASPSHKAANLRLLAMDVDGTLTDGRIYIGEHGEAMKAFCVRDGMGLTLLKEAGIVLAIITARRSEIVERRARELGIAEVFQGVHDKREAFEQLCARRAVALAQAGFVGDDWPDLPAMDVAGFAATVADGAQAVRARADWISSRRAGDGAIRELAEFILDSRGALDAALARRLTGRGASDPGLPPSVTGGRP